MVVCNQLYTFFYLYVVTTFFFLAWSAPSAIMTGGMGFGGQVGAELTDFIMVLNTTSAVKTFMHHGSITLGGNISGINFIHHPPKKKNVFFLKKILFLYTTVAAGPVGRNAEASGTASLKSVAAVYSYSKTRGLFAGVSLEGSVIFERFDANKKMYGGKVKSRDLLNGSIAPPASASELYRALELKTQGAGRTNTGRYEYRNDVNTDRYEYRNDINTENDDVSFASNNGPARSFSRAKVHSMAKTGSNYGNSSSNYGDGNTDHYVNRNRIEYYGSGRFNSSSDFDSSTPEQITNSQSRNKEDTELKARALFNFTGEQEGDLIFHKGDIITIIQKTNTQNDWWTGRLNHRQGIVKYFVVVVVYLILTDTYFIFK